MARAHDEALDAHDERAGQAQEIGCQRGLIGGFTAIAVTELVHAVWAMIAMVASVATVLVNSFAGRLRPASPAHSATGD